MPKLNPNEAPIGFQAKVWNHNCRECAFYENPKCGKILCCAFQRKDGGSVIFVKKPQRKPREWMAWARVWKDADSKESDVACVYNRRIDAYRWIDTKHAKVIRIKITEVV